MNAKEIIDIHVVAEITGYSEKTLYEMVSSRRIPHLKIGRSVRFTPSDIQAWLESKRVPTLEM